MQENTQTQLNEQLNEILINMTKDMCTYFQGEEAQISLKVTLYFDESQRVSRFENLFVNEKLIMPENMSDICESLNRISVEITKLPEDYRLESCDIDVKSDGKFSVTPKYRNR